MSTCSIAFALNAECCDLGYRSRLNRTPNVYGQGIKHLRNLNTLRSPKYAALQFDTDKVTLVPARDYLIEGEPVIDFKTWTQFKNGFDPDERHQNAPWDRTLLVGY